VKLVYRAWKKEGERPFLPGRALIAGPVAPCPSFLLI
jgi:hypothetical protein